jgi:hypothetical protein
MLILSFIDAKKEHNSRNFFVLTIFLGKKAATFKHLISGPGAVFTTLHFLHNLRIGSIS